MQLASGISDRDLGIRLGPQAHAVGGDPEQPVERNLNRKSERLGTMTKAEK
jgi:hypothetical protein